MLKKNDETNSSFNPSLLETPKGRGFGRLFFSIVVPMLILLVLAGAAIWQYKRTAFKEDLPAPVENGAKIVTPTAEPVALHIPSLKIDAPFVPLSLNWNHTLEVPKGDKEVGWFIYGAKPGDVGPAVIVGHLDSPKGPAVFQNLKNIKPGEEVNIDRKDGSSVTYVIDTISNYSQDNFPTKEVYGGIDFAGIRLITCSGYFDTRKGHYSENLIAFGHLKE